VHEPELILADEPTGNLDAESAAAVLALLRGAADDGRAVVLVTHEEAATSAADRVLRLVDGRLEP
jgi:ABC-type lipoprotein export system ATPase subunit